MRMKAYLLNKDTKELYLVLEIAATEALGPQKAEDGTNVFTGIVGKKSPVLKQNCKRKRLKFVKSNPMT